MKKWILFSGLLMVGPLWGGGVPSQITYQGTLKQAGAAANGAYTMIFRLTDSGGLVQYWSSGPTSVTVSQGLFSTVLSPSGVDWQNVVPFIEVNVNGQTLLPREPVTSTAYALMSGSIANGSILAGMIAMFSGPCPTGWTPFTALQGRFPVGSDPANPAQFSLDQQGGQLDHTHTIALDGAHNHGGMTGIPNHELASEAGNNFLSPGGGHTHTIAMAGAHNHGGDTGHASNLPPYLTLSFCQKQ